MRRSRFQVYRILFVVSFLGLVYYNFIGWSSSSSSSSSDQHNRPHHRQSNDNNDDAAGRRITQKQNKRDGDGLFIEMPKFDDIELDAKKVHDSFRQLQTNQEFRNPNNPGPVPDFVNEPPRMEDQVKEPVKNVSLIWHFILFK